MNALEVNERSSQAGPVSKVDLSAYSMIKFESPKASISDSKSLPSFQLDNSSNGQTRDSNAGKSEHSNRLEPGRGTGSCFPGLQKQDEKSETLKEAKKIPGGKPNKLDDSRITPEMIEQMYKNSEKNSSLGNLNHNLKDRNTLDGQKRDPDAGTPDHRGDKYESGRGGCFPQPKEQTKGEKFEEYKNSPDGKLNKINERRFENSQVNPQSKTELIDSVRKQIEGLYKINPSSESLKK
jgi:hypothetical protein